MKQHCLVFDIGKTNKKLFVFDEDYAVVYQESQPFPEISDEDGYPCDDLDAVSEWILERYQWLIQASAFEIHRVNFTSYGASWVHLDAEGKAVTPLYNYLKPFPESLKKNLAERYDWKRVEQATASAFAGMLNSGLQLYWLQQARPQQFKAVCTSLHLPQYLSFLFTQKAVSEYSSIGCHTALWDFTKGTYHHWMVQEGLDQKQAPLHAADETVGKTVQGSNIHFGIGIHDSSAALVPYLKAIPEPFLLLSTGTWTVALNPFAAFETHEASETLYYLQTNGKPVKAARLFLGKEHDEQVEALGAFFQAVPSYFHTMPFQQGHYEKLTQKQSHCFHWENLEPTEATGDWKRLPDPDRAYHQLVYELVQVQKRAIYNALGSTACKRIYVDGGFAGNQVFVHTLAHELPDFTFFTANNGIATALGAAMVLSPLALSEEDFCRILRVETLGPRK